MKAKGFSGDVGNGAEGVLSALGAAEDAVSRLDARLTQSPLADGWKARVVCHEVVAWRWNAGDAAPLEEVVLHATRLGQQAPDASVSAAVEALARRRRAERLDAGALSHWEEIKRLLKRRRSGLDRRSQATEQLLAATAPRRPLRPSPALPSCGLPVIDKMNWPVCVQDQDDAVFAVWVSTFEGFAEARPLLRAAAALDHWATIEPLVRESDVAALVVTARLREARRLRASPLLVEMGRRSLSRDGRHWSPWDPPAERAAYWLWAIALGAEAGAAELDLLSIARQRLDQALRGRRASSRLPGLAKLMLDSPVVTANMVVDALDVTPQAARMLLAQLDGVVRETTGRTSYRIWRI